MIHNYRCRASSASFFAADFASVSDFASLKSDEARVYSVRVYREFCPETEILNLYFVDVVEKSPSKEKYKKISFIILIICA